MPCQTLQSIPGVKNLSDNIIVYGTSQKDLDDALRAVLSRLKESGLTLIHKNVSSANTVLNSLVLSISADPRKVVAIHQATEPKNPSEIRSLLDMADDDGER